MLKKIAVSAMAVLIVLTMAIGVFADGEAVWQNKQVTAKVGNIAVDGVIDDVWNYAEWIPVTNLKTGLYKEEGGHSPEDYAQMNCKVLWNGTDTIYVLFDIHDKVIFVNLDEAWETDSIEFFIDEDNVREGDRKADKASFRCRIPAVEGEFTGFNEGNPDNYKGFVTFTDYGYVIEMSYKYSSLTPKDGHISGIDFQVNDDANGDGKREACVGWCDVDDSGCRDNTVWGEVIFSAEPAVPVIEEVPAAETAAPAVSAPQTDDAVVGAVIASVAALGVIAVISKKRK